MHFSLQLSAYHLHNEPHIVSNCKFILILSSVGLQYCFSRGKWSHLGQMKNHLLSIAWKNKLFLLYLIGKFNCKRIVKKTEKLLSNPAVIFYMLCKNFFYTQLAFFSDLWKRFHWVHDNIDDSFLFLLHKNFDTSRGSFSLFPFF